jgi:hypothetical protein
MTNRTLASEGPAERFAVPMKLGYVVGGKAL